MAKNSIRDFSATAGSNTDIQSVNIDENCPASGINNAIRELMVDLKNVSTGAVNLETPVADSLTVAGDLTVDTNTLKVDSSNNRLGIGTASPGVKFELNNGGAGSMMTITDGVSTNFNFSTSGTVGSFGTDAGGTSLALKTSGSEKVRITSGGEVGIGTSPDSPLHVIGDGKFKGSGETKIRFQNDTTGTGNSDGSFVGVFGGTEGMALYNYEATPMRFFTSNTERMRIAAGTSGGLVRIGQSSDFAGGANSRLAVFVDSSSPAMVTETGDTSGRSHLSFRNGNGEVGGIDTSGSSTSYNTSSDHRLKENVADMTGAIDRVKTLAPKRFNFIADADTTVDGFLAHEAQAVVPEAITGTHNEVKTWTQQEIDDGDAPDGTSAGDNKLDGDGKTIPVMQGIDQSKLVPLLTGALKEAVAKIETLETEMTALKARVTALEA